MREQMRADIPLGTGGRSAFLTYEPYYGLKEKPFSLSADPRFLYKSQAHAPTFEALRAGIRRREGLIVLTGEPGTGKTTLCRSVLEALDRKTFCTLVPDPFVSREDLLKMLLLDFGVMSVEDLRSGRLQGASRPELSYPLYEFLKSLVPLQAYAVLIIDEAQNLAPQLLEEIRILADLEAPEKLLQLVLVGQPELRTKLKDHAMRQVDQRVSVRVELLTLDRPGVGEYIAHRLNIAGGGTDRVTFADDAIDVIFRATKGNPRLINLTCDRALHHGHVVRTFTIGPEIVTRSLVELGMADPSATSAASPVARPPLTAAPSAVAAAALTPTPPLTAIPAAPPPAAATPPSAPTPPVVATPAAGTPAMVTPAAETTRVSAVTPAAATTPAVTTRSSAATRPLVTAKAPARVVETETPAAPASEPDDFGLSEKFFETPRLADRDLPPEPPDSPLFANSRSEVEPTGRRRTVLIVLVCLLAPALIALLVWAWQQNTFEVGAMPALPAVPPKAVAVAPKPAESISQIVPDEPVGQPFEVGVALFTGYERANRLAVALAASGFRAITRPLESSQGRMYEVRTGPYQTREAAEADAELIRKLPGYGDARVISPPTAVPPTAAPPTAVPQAAVPQAAVPEAAAPQTTP